ncbi:MAG: DNA recombination protein RmuC [Thermodesulfobacteriota bacterium]
MIANLYLALGGAFALGVLLGLPIMWLFLRTRLKAQESRQAESAQMLQDALLAKERLDAEIERLPQLEEENKTLQDEKVQLVAKLSALETTLSAAAEKETWLSRAQENMREAFQALAAQALTSNSEAFLSRTRDAVQNFYNQMTGGWQTHKAEIQNLVQPLDQALQVMSQHVRELEGKREGAYSDLKANLTQLNQLNQELQRETSKLSQALRAGAQQRGRWAEFQLQRLAELAGMKDRVDFNLQVGVGEVRPDMVIRLPRNGCIVVDAKAPMTHYLEAQDLTNEESRRKKLEEHARRVRQHVDNLRSKEYARHLPEGSQFVVMYLPSDACLIGALDSDSHLLEYAFDKQITLATPTILFALLKTVATGWQQYLIDENAKKILACGQELSHRLYKFASHFGGIGKGLKTAVDKYNDAVGSFESRILPEARRFQELRGSSEPLPEIKAADSQPRQLDQLDSSISEASALPEIERG